MPDLDRVVAGLRCRDVLESLSDFLDGTLTRERVDQVKAHLDGCSTCAQFGSDMSHVLASLRAGRTDLSPPLEDEALARLRGRIRSAITPTT
jgi:anti-sigma factor RsiW